MIQAIGNDNKTGSKKVTAARLSLGIFLAAAVILCSYLVADKGLYLRITHACKEKEIASSKADAVLKGGVITAYNGEEIIFESDDDIYVEDALFTDIDQMGDEELVILCWKKGKYGFRKPFWVKEDTKKWIQHIYIYSVRNKSKSEAGRLGGSIEDVIVRPKWMASDIGLKVQKMQARGNNLLITDDAGVQSEWIWDSWGLSRIN